MNPIRDKEDKRKQHLKQQEELNHLKRIKLLEQAKQVYLTELIQEQLRQLSIEDLHELYKHTTQHMDNSNPQNVECDSFN